MSRCILLNLCVLVDEWEKTCGFFVIALDASGEDVVVPGVKLDAGFRECMDDGGLGFEVVELGDDVATDEGCELGLRAVCWVEGLAIFEGVFDVGEPEFGLGEGFEGYVVNGGFKRAAIGVAAEDDVADFENFNGVLDGCGDAVVGVVGFGGDDVTGVAGDEEIAGFGLQDEIGDDAGI